VTDQRITRGCSKRRDNDRAHFISSALKS